MTDKEKIAQIIAEHLCSQGKAHKTLYGSERMCYSRNNFAECEKVSECVDALIAAGIGDTTNLIVENEVLKRDIDNLERTLEEGAEELQEAQHRAEVAERALLNACVNLIKDEEDNVNMELLARVVYTNYLRKAERDRVEERKDD